MKLIRLTILSIFLTACVFQSARASGAATPDKGKPAAEGKIVTAGTDGTEEKVDTDKVVEALSVVVHYKNWREDQGAVNKALERSAYPYSGYSYRDYEEYDRDPFAFKSKRVKELLSHDKMSRKEFERAVDRIQNSLDELKESYYEREDD